MPLLSFPPHPWWSQQKKELKEYLVPHTSCFWPCLCWVSLSIHQLRWRKRGEEVVGDRAGALESCVVPGICCTGFTRTGSSSLNRLTCFLQCPLCWILGFYFLWGILEILENGFNWLSLVVEGHIILGSSFSSKQHWSGNNCYWLLCIAQEPSLSQGVIHTIKTLSTFCQYLYSIWMLLLLTVIGYGLRNVALQE